MTDFNHIADLRSLVAAIASSPIVIAAAKAPARDFADWCERQNGDLDSVVLDWLRSQVPLRASH